MKAEERASSARAKRSAIIAQRAIDALGGTEEAYHWLTSPCPALRGKAPADLRYDMAAYRNVKAVLRRRQRRARAVKSAAIGSFAEERAYVTWLWSRCSGLNGRLPGMLLDTDRGARQVVRAIPTRRASRHDPS